MKSIKPLPHDDSSLVNKICKNKPGWLSHKDKWLQTYKDYLAARGNPWDINPSSDLTAIKDDLIALYNSYRSRGYIEQIRNYQTEGSCPACGSLAAGTVDHFLPKHFFPEFSIYSLNLIPACASCNSSQKGDTYRGEKRPARFIHPYFDTLGEKPILSVEIKAPFEAAQFIPKPATELVGEEAEIVRFHLNSLLGNSFIICVRNLFTKLPATIADDADPSCTYVTSSAVRTQVQQLLRYSQRTYGLNSWPAGFYRGLLANDAALSFVAQQASKLLPLNKSPALLKAVAP